LATVFGPGFTEVAMGIKRGECVCVAHLYP
jgi:hypothetical protein